MTKISSKFVSWFVNKIDKFWNSTAETASYKSLNFIWPVDTLDFCLSSPVVQLMDAYSNDGNLANWVDGIYMLW